MGCVHLTRFYVCRRVPVIAGAARHTFRLLSDDWSGRVTLLGVTGRRCEELAAKTIARGLADAATSQESHADQGLSRERLLDAVREAAGFTLRAQNTNPQSPTHGGPFLFYDLDARTWRTSYWMWGWGPSVKLLLDAAKLPEVTRVYPAARLRRVADEIGRASLRMQVRDKNSPANGLGIASWTRGFGSGPEYEGGYRICVTATDAMFLAGWAWAPLYEATGAKIYLNNLETLAPDDQYSGPDPAARGSIVGRSTSSAVGYRWWFDVSCTYTTAFYALAALEELRIQESYTSAK